MKHIVECIVELEGWPTYLSATRFYVEQNGEIYAGPFETIEEAEKSARVRILRIKKVAGIVGVEVRK